MAEPFFDTATRGVSVTLRLLDGVNSAGVRDADVLVLTTDADALDAASAYLEAQPELWVTCVAKDAHSARYFTASSRAAGSESPKTSETSVTIDEEKEILAELDVHSLVQAIRGARRAG